MAGTIVADTLQDGAGNSTSMDNAIYGSAKAWVNFNGISSTSIRASYNVSSVTYVGTGIYTINFTNAFSDTNYVQNISAAPSYGNQWLFTNINVNGGGATESAPTASSCTFTLYSRASAATLDSKYVCFTAFR